MAESLTYSLRKEIYMLKKTTGGDERGKKKRPRHLHNLY